MRGPIAAVGGRVLDAQAQKLIAQTFVNVREQLTSAGKSHEHVLRQGRGVVA